MIASFTRMKQLTDNMEVVIEAVSSLASDLIELSEDKSMIRRVAAVPESLDTMAQTIHISNLPLESTIDSIEEMLSEFKVAAVRLCKTFKKEFKGAAFVEFSTVEEAQSALKYLADSKPEFKACFKQEYWENENKKRLEKVQSKENAKKKIIEEKLVSCSYLAISNLSFDGEEDEKVHFALLDLKKKLRELEPSTAYLTKTEDMGVVVRFNDIEAAKKLHESIQATPFEFNGISIETRLLSAEEEEGFKAKNAFSAVPKSGRGGHKGGRRGGQKRQKRE